jgi:hypothetical protein
MQQWFKAFSVIVVAGCCLAACNPVNDSLAGGEAPETNTEPEPVESGSTEVAPVGEEAQADEHELLDPAAPSQEESSPPPAEQTAEEEYELVPPGELAFEIREFYYDGVVASDGVKPTGGEIGQLLCGVKPIELSQSEFVDGHIVTKDFGRIRVRFSSSLTSGGFAVFLKPSQKSALARFCAS